MVRTESVPVKPGSNKITESVTRGTLTVGTTNWFQKLVLRRADVVKLRPVGAQL